LRRLNSYGFKDRPCHGDTHFWTISQFVMCNAHCDVTQCTPMWNLNASMLSTIICTRTRISGLYINPWRRWTYGRLPLLSNLTILIMFVSSFA
jgi:hypothetical protein